MEKTDSRKPLGGARILLLEDDALISIDAEDMLLALGARQVLVAHTLADGDAVLDREAVDAAVLDVMIGRKTCDGLARQLLARGIPFVFTSGYGDRSILPEDLRHVPQVLKPCSAEALADAFAAIGLSIGKTPPPVADAASGGSSPHPEVVPRPDSQACESG